MNTLSILIMFVMVVGVELDDDNCLQQLAHCQAENQMFNIELKDLQAERDRLYDEIADMSATYRNDTRALMERYHELREKYEDVLTELNKTRPFEVFGYISSALIVMWSLWAFVPILYYRSRWMGERLVNGISNITNWPRRIWTRRQADLGEYIDMTDYTPEAVLANSALNPVKAGEYAPSIIKIFKVDKDFANQLEFIGHGFWAACGDPVKGTIITAAHVVLSRGKLLLMNANEETKHVEVESADFKYYDDYDVACLTPSQQTTTTLGVRKAKVPKQRLRTKVVVKAFGRRHQTCGTISLMENDSVYVKYEGSSVGGFSGSPYVSNNLVYGMHVGSTGEIGMGLDMGFLAMKFNYEFKNYTEESSESWLVDEITKKLSRGKKLQWKSYGHEDVVLDINGQDFFLDRGAFNELENKYNSAFMQVRAFEYKPESFEDNDKLPKNYQSPTPVLVVGEKNVDDVPSQSNPKLRKLSNLNGEVKLSMDGPTSTHVPSSEAFLDMHKSLHRVLQRLESHLGKLDATLSKVLSEKPEKSGKKEKPKKI